MHLTLLNVGLFLASASLSFGLPADSTGMSINPSYVVLESFPLLARDSVAADKLNRCGPKHGDMSCASDRVTGGQFCCSTTGWCGSSQAHCGKGCQAKYGQCTGKKFPKPPGHCGPKYGGQKCTNNECCSEAGYCGTGKEYCSSPGECRRHFGRCDADMVPAGIPTSRDRHQHHHDKLPFNVPIMKCKKPGTIAMTFDDGPSENTMALLDMLADAGAKATFFIGANNNGKGEIDLNANWTAAIRRMDADGHQVASHTWSHPHLDNLDSHERKEEMYKSERALANIIGKYPRYMRAPYEIDSGDWDVKKTFEAKKAGVTRAFDQKPKDGSMLLIQHDIYTRVLDLSGHVLSLIKEKGWKAVTLSECLNEPADHAYSYPTWVEAKPMARKGCMVSQPGFCGHLKPFEGKEKCFDSNGDCYKQMKTVMKKAKDSRGHGDMKQLCKKQTLFCAQCDTKRGPHCKSDEFVFKRKH